MRQVTKETVGERKDHDVKSTTKELVCVGMFTAVLATLSQIAIPMPSGVPITLQIFAVALTGVVLAWKLSTVSVIVYILLGVVGVPVFSEFSGGIHIVLGYTGGFIWGFIALTLLCGVGSLMKNKILGTLLGIVGLVLCHLFGVIQFMIVLDMGLGESFFLSSAPYLVKDIISVILAYMVGYELRARLLKAGLL